MPILVGIAIGRGKHPKSHMFWTEDTARLVSPVSIECTHSLCRATHYSDANRLRRVPNPPEGTALSPDLELEDCAYSLDVFSSTAYMTRSYSRDVMCHNLTYPPDTSNSSRLCNSGRISVKPASNKDSTLPPSMYGVLNSYHCRRLTSISTRFHPPVPSGNFWQFDRS